MNLTCIIVDDEPLAVSLLESFVGRTSGLELLASFTDSVEAVAAIRDQKPDLVFLDIQMPDLNGMDLARIVPEQTSIIFTTAFKEYAFESYEVSALDFLLKPIRYNKFLVAVEKARKRKTPLMAAAESSTEEAATTNADAGQSASRSSCFIRVDGELRQLPFASILYVSGMKDYVMFYLEGERRPLITHLTMKSVEDMLPRDRFLRVHRSYIIALDHIRKVDRNDCIYIGDEVIHVTDAYADDFHRFLNARTFGK
ncbi:MAG: LytTR family DNA-binding domain-containing protein [Prevotella sp.]|nr:LytTR family DNA-binding domain-containing protein [Prevotella sp.]